MAEKNEQDCLDMKMDLEEVLPEEVNENKTEKHTNNEAGQGVGGNESNATANESTVDGNDDAEDNVVVDSTEESMQVETEGDDNTEETKENIEDEMDPTDLIAKAVSQKDEGNAHFKSGDLNLASRCYRKGSSLLKKLNHANSGDDQVKALLLNLQTNLSMVCFKQNKHQQSRDIATKALNIDSKNVKALYRRAMANRKLGDLDAARKDLREAWKQDPKNKDVQRGLHGIKKEADQKKSREKAALSKAFSSKSSLLYNDKEEEEKRRIAEKQAQAAAKEEEKKKRKVEWEEECVQRLSKGEEVITFEDWEKERKEKEQARKKAKQEEEDRKRAQRISEKKAERSSIVESDNDDDDELTEREMQMFRGYKKTSDGKTTSYFNREQTAEEKNLLGSIAPQRLDAAPQGLGNVTNSNIISPEGSTGSSVWNQAGTWEERNTSDWCTDSLRQHLLGAKIKPDQGSLEGSIKEIKNLTGEASVAFVSGKKRYVFDYNAQLKYNIVDTDTDEKLASGKLNLPDISSTAMNDDLDIEICCWSEAPISEHENSVLQCREALVTQIRNQVSAFVAAFNEQF